MHMQAFRLLRFKKSNRVGVPPFPPCGSSQNGPRCKGFAAPRRNCAPLTAPGRSEETFPYKRERTVGNLMTPASKHLANANAIRLKAPAQRQGGWMSKTFAASSSQGELFLLTSFFIEPKGFGRR